MLLRTLVAACSLMLPGGVLAQSVAPLMPVPATPVEESHATFRSGVDLVTLNVTVTDGQDHHLPGLNQQDFQVLEDGVPQQLSFFAASQVPLDVALLIDCSSSMQEKLEIVREAANKFLDTLRPGDRGELVSFNSQTKVLQAMTTDFPALHAAVGKTVARGGTALYTALYITLDQFMKRAPKNAEVRRPAIIVLTDGEDTASLIQFEDLLERARRAGVAVYSISVVSPSDAKETELQGGKRYITESDYALKTLAKETGARAFFPLQISELTGVYASVATELSTQYALGYAPRLAKADGAFHRVMVRLMSRPDARLRTRTGYYSPHTSASLR
jgi:Ca-activated chloride channel family protein